ncbi:MAG: hypothetical protein ACPG06_11330 [Alphaproteobacteria bacterium]
MLQFQNQESSQTLSEGIAEFHAANPQLATRNFSGALAASFFPAHDAMHVLFGQNTDIDGEAIVKYWTIGATDLGFWGLFKYRNVQEVVDLRQGLPMRSYLRIALPMIPGLLPAFLRGLKIAKNALTKPWAHFDWQQHLDRPLNEIRAEYGIDIHALDEAAPKIPAELRAMFDAPQPTPKPTN